MKGYLSTSSKQRSSLWTEDEIIVSQILVDLEGFLRAIEIEESSPRLVWGCRKRRSCLDETLSTAISSPATPLSFSLTESDEHPNKTCLKMSKEEKYYMDMIAGLTQCGDSLRREIEKVKIRHAKLISFNSELKSMKQEIILRNNKCTRKEEIAVTGHYGIMSSFGPINGLNMVKRVGPFTIPDLNLSAEEASQPLDAIRDKQSRFAEARRLRRGIIKIKSMRRACGIKLPSY